MTSEDVDVQIIEQTLSMVLVDGKSSVKLLTQAEAGMAALARLNTRVSELRHELQHWLELS